MKLYFPGNVPFLERSVVKMYNPMVIYLRRKTSKSVYTRNMDLKKGNIIGKKCSLCLKKLEKANNGHVHFKIARSKILASSASWFN